MTTRAAICRPALRSELSVTSCAHRSELAQEAAAHMRLREELGIIARAAGDGDSQIAAASVMQQALLEVLDDNIETVESGDEDTQAVESGEEETVESGDEDTQADAAVPTWKCPLSAWGARRVRLAH